jgi:N utilization substance protein B
MKNGIKPTISRDYVFKFLYHTQFDFFKNKDICKENQFDQDSLNKKLETFNTCFKESDPEHLNNFINYETLQHAKELIEGILKNYNYLIEIIQKNSNNWKIERIGKIDLTVLLIGTFELEFIQSTPVKVVINEAINLVKKYGREDSHAFINGIMQSILTNKLKHQE